MNVKKIIETGLLMSGLNNRQLAEKIDVTGPSISNMKKNNAMSSSTRNAMANAFGVKASVLLSWGEE